MKNLVEYVNTNKFTWKAQINPRFSGLSLAELKQDASVGPTHQRILAQTNAHSVESVDEEKLLRNVDFLKVWTEAKQYWNTSIEDFNEKELPASWDWRNISGYDFTTPVRDQGGCGSCYTISFITSLESRVKILTGKTQILSPQFMLNCNFFNEGCNGGWPILNGLFAESFWIPLESCAKYDAQTVKHTCSDFSHCEKAVSVEKSYYIGNYYGGSSESAMMREIRSRGPVVGDLDVPLGFSYYKEGIFSDDHIKQLKELGNPTFVNEQTGSDIISDYTLNDYHVEWQYINHSILIIGWGEENGVKFWICRNSYGTHYGEQGGHFRVRRGANDFGIESEPSAYIPKIRE